MVDWNIHQNNAGALINSLSQIVSANVEPLKVKFNAKNSMIELLATDRTTDVDVFVKLPATNIQNSESFALPLDRLRLMIAKQQKVSLELKKGTLHYRYGNIQGIVETEDCSVDWKFPIPNNDAYLVSVFLLKNAALVKLLDIYNEGGTNLFISYKSEEQALMLASADNFNVACLLLKNVKFWKNDWETVVPYKYVDYARKLASLTEDSKIYLSNQEKQFYLYSNHTAIQLPSYAIDQTQINMKFIDDHVKSTSPKEGVKFDHKELQSFMHNALTIKEKDRSAEILLHLRKGILHYVIETKHGSVKAKTELPTEIEFKIKLGCASLVNLLSKIDEEAKTHIKVINKSFVCITATNGDSYLNLSSYGLAED